MYVVDRFSPRIRQKVNYLQFWSNTVVVYDHPCAIGHPSFCGFISTCSTYTIPLLLPNNPQHAIVLFGCGTGKSGIYILQQLACCMFGINWPKSIFISPHNTLLAMHNMQATKYFLGTSLRVKKLLPSDVASGNHSSEFVLPFISIQNAFKDLMDVNPNQLCQWNIKNIFVDEYHNLFGELFRHTNSWTSLQNLARHNIKITLGHFILD